MNSNLRRSVKYANPGSADLHTWFSWSAYFSDHVRSLFALILQNVPMRVFQLTSLDRKTQLRERPMSMESTRADVRICVLLVISCTRDWGKTSKARVFRHVSLNCKPTVKNHVTEKPLLVYMYVGAVSDWERAQAHTNALTKATVALESYEPRLCDCQWQIKLESSTRSNQIQWSCPACSSDPRGVYKVITPKLFWIPTHDYHWKWY